MLHKLHSTVFTFDVRAYAVISNYYHVVLHVDRNRTGVVERRGV